MRRHARATADDEYAPAREVQRRERVVTRLAVVAVAVAAILAAVMQSRPHDRPDAPRLALAAAGTVQAPPLAPRRDSSGAACAECGVVEAVVPLGLPAGEAGMAWQMRIRMDDGSLRTVAQRGALAAGSRVTVAGGSIRVLSNPPGQG